MDNVFVDIIPDHEFLLHDPDAHFESLKAAAVKHSHRVITILKAARIPWPISLQPDP
jgi:hypothetical protein